MDVGSRAVGLHSPSLLGLSRTPLGRCLSSLGCSPTGLPRPLLLLPILRLLRLPGLLHISPSSSLRLLLRLLLAVLPPLFPSSRTPSLPSLLCSRHRWPLTVLCCRPARRLRCSPTSVQGLLWPPLVASLLPSTPFALLPALLGLFPLGLLCDAGTDWKAVTALSGERGGVRPLSPRLRPNTGGAVASEWEAAVRDRSHAWKAAPLAKGVGAASALLRPRTS